jgi:hypothetical protein
VTRSDYQHCPPCRAVFLVTEDRCPNCGAANDALPVPEEESDLRALVLAVCGAYRTDGPRGVREVLETWRDGVAQGAKP